MATESRVLIIEDDDVLRVMLFTILRHQPLAVDTATTADEAMEKTSVCDYALILLDADLPDNDAADFDAVMLPGGVINADALRIEKKAQQFVQEIDRAGKPIAVICHGPWLLVSAGLVRGHTITSWPTLQDDLRNAGATWRDKECIRDGTWVSSRKPDDLPLFNREMVKLFAETQPAAAMRAENRESLGVRS